MSTEAPKYRIKQDSHIDDGIVLAGATYTDTTSKHIPGPHWEPLNDAAKAKAAEARIVYTGEVPDSIDVLTAKLAKAMADKKAAEGSEMAAATGAAVVKALIDAGVITVKDAKAAGKARVADEV